MITVEELAKKIGGTVDGDCCVVVAGISDIEDVRDGCAVYVENAYSAARLVGKNPAVVICGEGLKLEGFNLIRVKNPKVGFAQALAVFHPSKMPPKGIHPSAVVEEGARVDASASVGALCFVGRGAEIGAEAVISSSCHVGEDARIGEGCLLHPGVRVLDGCVLGRRVILNSNVVIGGDGFGFAQDGGRHVKVPQVGNVVIEDDVEIGANSAVDRATIGSTVIGSGTKIDNLVQVGHNVKIGKNCILCGQAGLSGSCVLEDGVVLAGQVGVGDHIRIGAGSILGGKAGVATDIPPGVFYSGFPARPHTETLRIFSTLKRLPKIAKDVDKLMKIHEEPDDKTDRFC